MIARCERKKVASDTIRSSSWQVTSWESFNSLFHRNRLRSLIDLRMKWRKLNAHILQATRNFQQRDFMELNHVGLYCHLRLVNHLDKILLSVVRFISPEWSRMSLWVERVFKSSVEVFNSTQKHKREENMIRLHHCNLLCRSLHLESIKW